MNANYLKEVVKEVKMSTFPTQNVVINFTIFVILFTVVVAAYLGGLDIVFGKGTVGFIETLKSSALLSQFQAQTSSVLEVATTTIEAATGTASITNLLVK